ncbi:MAG: hypothetical protein JNN29_01195 [Chitinophagaceae bacterium]|nr:hypothetical protein [Chitinophagaceae bacterium]
MERIKALIDKLKQQADQQADAGQMLLTVQSLQQALQQVQAQKGRTLGTSKVAVVYPASGARMAMVQVEEEIVIEEKKIEAPVAPPAYSYDPILEIPTLTHQKTSREINEALAEQNTSINDRLSVPKSEVGGTLIGDPVQDLRKAIGINDRFTFISELFRGDEAMYERSLKTINNFGVHSEAEYWISRELEIKLGWDAGSETVIHFYQLVKRRFGAGVR